MTGRLHLERVGRDGLLALTALGFGLILLWALFFRETSLTLPLVGLVLVALALTLGGWGLLAERQSAAESLRAFQLMADDPAPCFMTDTAGHLILRNLAAETRFGADVRSLHDAFGRFALFMASVPA